MNKPKIVKETFNVKVKMIEIHHAQIALRDLRKLYFGEKLLYLELMGEPVANEEVQKIRI